MADSADDQQQSEATAKTLNKTAATTTTLQSTMANVPIANASAAYTHPLQDINLNQDDVDFVREMPAAGTTALTTTAAAAKGNWVKFDDDVNEIEVNNENSINNNNNNNNNITNNSNSTGVAGKVISFIDSEKNTAQTTTTQAIPKAATTTHHNEAATTTTTTAAASLETKNKLSSLLPPPPQPAQRSRTPTSLTTSESKQEQQRSRARTPEQQTNRATSAATTITTKADIAPAVLSTESTHVNLNSSGRTPPAQKQQQQQQQQNQKSSKAVASGSPQQQQHHSNNNGSTSSAMAKATTPAASNIVIPVDSAPGMRTIELSTGRVHEGFANGDVIVTLLPANTKWPWITPAIFRPELVPEELMAQGLTLTVEEYVQAMETLVNDYRFTFYNICYKRILVCWIFFAFSVLLTLLFSGLQGVALFSLGVGWLFLNAAAIFLCMWAKLRLSRGLEKCLARVNKQLMKHKILLVLDDRGRISCHKVNLCFLYFDATLCVEFLNQFLEHTAQNGGEAVQAGWERKLDIDLNDIVIQGSNPVRLSRKQERGVQVFLRYASRWGMEALRGWCDVTPSTPGRHCLPFQCPCQYIVEHLTCKPRGYPCSCIAYASDPQFQNRY